jgi:carboxymethylenebutenolidase
MPHDSTDVRTQDGTCPIHTFVPAGTGQWPGVLLFMDAIGIRPALFDVAERLANHGYVVAVPDLYYRSGYVPPTGVQFFADPDIRAHWMKNILPTVSGPNVMRDMPAFLEQLDSRGDVCGGSLGVTGYCLGGRLALNMRARVYVGGASQDSSFDDAQKARLEAALTEAHVDHRIETYDARHGWVLSDMPVHDPIATERHWATLLDLFDGTLR